MSYRISPPGMAPSATPLPASPAPSRMAAPAEPPPPEKSSMSPAERLRANWERGVNLALVNTAVKLRAQNPAG